jgi:3D (Asp-Asp-Asp) domain-containing protein
MVERRERPGRERPGRTRREVLRGLAAFAAGAAAGGFAGEEITKEEIRNLVDELERLEAERAVLKAEIARLRQEKGGQIKELEEKIARLMQEKEEAERRARKLEEEISKLKEAKFIPPRKLKVTATAYTAGPESTGKTPEHPAFGITFSGWKADIGVIAVDPEVIPLGSIVYVPGYGYAIALDRGGAIKGNRIDLFFHDPQKALEWGVREVEIIVIGRIENFELITKELKKLGLAR